MGLPKATATPAAEAAVTISRIFAEKTSANITLMSSIVMPTMTPAEATEAARDDMSYPGCDVHGRAFFAHRQSRRNRNWLSQSQ